jgi:hypothetical protein
MSVPYSPVVEADDGYVASVESLENRPSEDAAQLEARLKDRRVVFQMDAYYRDAWKMFKTNFCVILGVQITWALLFAGIFIGAFMFMKHVLHLDRHHHRHHHDDDDDDMKKFTQSRFWIMVAVHLAANWLACVFLIYPLAISWYQAVFNAIRSNGKLRFCHFFSAYCCRKWDSFKFGTIFFILSVILYLLFILPAVVFVFFTVLSLPLFVDRKSIPVGVWKSFKLSHLTVRHYLCSLVGFLLASALVLFAGALLFGVGLIVALPVVFFAKCYLYHHLVGVEGVPLVDAGLPAPFSGTSIVPSSVAASTYPGYAAAPSPVAASTYPAYAAAPFTRAVLPVASTPAVVAPPQPMVSMVSTTPSRYAFAPQPLPVSAQGSYVPIAAPMYPQ